ncbi:L,D-transpeptidase [Ramlibacter sp. AN1015]|uniref:L,D-transpeptidase n=1 Tax=Ramlibacter sp. AN1015 TaxID=3133428 RepID=UPI0030BFF42E
MQWKAWALAGALAGSCAWANAQARVVQIDFAHTRPSQDARDMAAWVASSGDASGKPFAIVDKKNARLFLFDASHRLLGSTEVLLGSTFGDESFEGVGERTQTGQVGLHERTTPAGRFETSPGRNPSGEDIVWLDFDAAFAIHRVRPGAQFAERLARLRSATPRDNRISLGCVVVPVAFYLEQVQPLFGRGQGVVYVLPETRTLQAQLEQLSL